MICQFTSFHSCCTRIAIFSAAAFVLPNSAYGCGTCHASFDASAVFVPSSEYRCGSSDADFVISDTALVASTVLVLRAEQGHVALEQCVGPFDGARSSKHS